MSQGRRIYVDGNSNFYADAYCLTPLTEYLPWDYWKSSHGWMASLPGGMVANLANHDVTEHADGTVTVSPSISCNGGNGDNKWHGYLKAGVFSEHEAK